MKRILTLAMLLMLSAVAFAHPGGTDASGGHRDRSTGEYHYHHGYSAHQHPDGVCPYDYDDKTGSRSGSSSTSRTVSYSASRYDWYDEYLDEQGAKQDAIRELNALKREYEYSKSRTYFFAGCIGLGAGIAVILIRRASFNRRLEDIKDTMSRRNAEEIEQLRRALATDYANSLRNAEQQANAALTQMRISLADEWSKRLNASVIRANNAEHALALERKKNSAAIAAGTPNESEPVLDAGLVYVPRDLNTKVYHRDFVGCGVSGMVLASKRSAVAYGLTQCPRCSHAAQPTGDIIVRAAPSGTKVYHSSDHGTCYGYLAKPIPLSEALDRGLRPCSKCSPPTENPKVYF